MGRTPVNPYLVPGIQPGPRVPVPRLPSKPGGRGGGQGWDQYENLQPPDYEPPAGPPGGNVPVEPPTDADTQHVDGQIPGYTKPSLVDRGRDTVNQTIVTVIDRATPKWVKGTLGLTGAMGLAAGAGWWFARRRLLKRLDAMYDERQEGYAPEHRKPRRRKRRGGLNRFKRKAFIVDNTVHETDNHYVKVPVVNAEAEAYRKSMSKVAQRYPKVASYFEAVESGVDQIYRNQQTGPKPVVDKKAWGTYPGWSETDKVLDDGTVIKDG